MAKVTTTIDFFPLGLALLVICFLGVLANLLCAFVLSRTKMRSTYSILTLGLTFCDGLYLLTKLIRYGLLSMFVYFDIFDGYTEVFYPIFGPYLRAITFTAQTGSTYFTIIVAVDRYVSVCWPVKAKFLCTKRRAHIGVIGVLFFSCLYNIPRWFEFHTESTTTTTCTFVDLNLTTSDCPSVTISYAMKQSPLRNEPNYQVFYIFWSYFVIMFFIPFTSLTYFNCAIFQAIKAATKARRQLSSQQKRETSFALMLFSVVVVFLACSVDYLVLDILSYLKIDYSPFWDRMGNVLLSLNSAVNFIIYCAFGKKFRNEFFLFLKEISKGKLCPNERSTTSWAGSRGGNSHALSGGASSTTKQNTITKDSAAVSNV